MQPHLRKDYTIYNPIETNVKPIYSTIHKNHTFPH